MTTQAATITDTKTRLKVVNFAREYTSASYPWRGTRITLSGPHGTGEITIKPEPGHGRMRRMVYGYHVRGDAKAFGFSSECPNVGYYDIMSVLDTVLDTPASTDTRAKSEPAAASDSAQPHAGAVAASAPDPVDWSAFKRAYCLQAPTWARWAAHLMQTRKPVSDEVKRLTGDWQRDPQTGGYVDMTDAASVDSLPF